MVSRFDDLRCGDVMGLVDVVREVIGIDLRSKLKRSLEDVTEILDGITDIFDDTTEDEGLKSLLDKKLKELRIYLYDWTQAKNDSFESYLDFKDIARDLIDELGRLGWEVLSPESVRKVKLAVSVRKNSKFPRLKVLKRRKNGTG